MSYQGFADISAAREHLQHTRGQASFFEYSGDGDTARDRGTGIRFENDRVAERQRGCHGPNAENDGDIERGDHSDDACGSPPGHGQPWLLTREKLTVRPARQAGGFVALLFRDVHCEAGHGRDSTDLTDVPP